MDDEFSVDDLLEIAASVTDAWRRGTDRDWTVRAGSLDWSCSRTADHAIDTLLAPAWFLASRRVDAYPNGGWSPGESATPEAFIEGVEIGARLLAGVVVTTPPDVRALLFRNYGMIGAPPDFAPRGALELVLHAEDVCSGLGLDLDPPLHACANLRAHVRDWPVWGDYWQTLEMSDDPWTDLLAATRRTRQQAS